MEDSHSETSDIEDTYEDDTISVIYDSIVINSSFKNNSSNKVHKEQAVRAAFQKEDPREEKEKLFEVTVDNFKKQIK